MTERTTRLPQNQTLHITRLRNWDKCMPEEGLSFPDHSTAWNPEDTPEPRQRPAAQGQPRSRRAQNSAGLPPPLLHDSSGGEISSVRCPPNVRGPTLSELPLRKGGPEEPMHTTADAERFTRRPATCLTGELGAGTVAAGDRHCTSDGRVKTDTLGARSVSSMHPCLPRWPKTRQVSWPRLRSDS